MDNNNQILLAGDAIINLLLGILLLLYPLGIPSYLGLPVPETYFYSSILGSVLLGIGLALALEWNAGQYGIRGLGLAGAIAINLCGGTALLLWLILGDMSLSLIGSVTLWTIAVVVLGIGMIELFNSL